MLVGRGVRAIAVSPTVSASNRTNTQTRLIPPCYSRFRVGSDGDMYESSASGVFSSSYETWLTSGLNSQVWVERSIDSGSLTLDDIGASRVACTTNRDLGVEDGTDNGIPTTCTVTLSFYDASSGGNLLDTCQLTMSASYVTTP